jgi:protein SCO1/2
MQSNRKILSLVFVGSILIGFPLVSVIMSKMGLERGKDLRTELGEYRFEPIGDFSMDNQLGKSFGRNDLHGKVVVASFISNDSSDDARHLLEELGKIQREFREEEDLLLLTFYTSAPVDSQWNAKVFAQKYGADSTRWHILTANAELMRRVVLQELHLDKTQDPGLSGPHPHSRYFALIDTAGRVRNFYEGVNSAEVLKMVEHIALLAPKDHSRKLQTR